MAYNIFKPKTLGNEYKCWYCGIEGFKMTKDHFYPRWLGGKLMVRCCHNCNGLKAGKTITQWIDWIETNNHPQKERMLRATVSLARNCRVFDKKGNIFKIIPDSYFGIYPIVKSPIERN